MLPISRITIALLLILPMRLSAEIKLPDMGDSSESVVSLSEERKIGAAFMRQARQQLDIIDDPLVQGYIQSLGTRLLTHIDQLGREFEFFVVNDSSINAFAAPGGYIGIHSGLILISQTESELSGVLAHEIAHVSQRHLARAYEEVGDMNAQVAAVIIAAILLGGASGDVGQAAIMGTMAGAQQYQLNFTRANEREADRVGMQLLVAEGFEPVGMPDFFERMAQANRYYGSELTEFLSTHPVTSSRIADSRGRAAQLGQTRHRDSLDYPLIKERLRVLQAKDTRQLVETYRKRRTGGQVTDPEAGRYGYGLALMFDEQYDEAGKVLDALLTSDVERPDYILAVAENLSRQGHQSQALTLLDKGSRLYPDHRAITLAQADVLARMGRLQASETVLHRLLRHTPDDPQLYQMLAQVAGRSGKKAEARYYRAQFAHRMGNGIAAMEQVLLGLQEVGEQAYMRAKLAAFQGRLKKEVDAMKKAVEQQGR